MERNPHLPLPDLREIANKKRNATLGEWEHLRLCPSCRHVASELSRRAPRFDKTEDKSVA